MFNSLPGNISSHTRARGGSSNLSNSPTLENPSLPLPMKIDQSEQPSISPNQSRLPPFDFNFAVIHLFPYPIEEQTHRKCYPIPVCVSVAEGVPLPALSWLVDACVRASRRPRFEGSQPRLEIHTQTHTHTHRNGVCVTTPRVVWLCTVLW